MFGVQANRIRSRGYSLSALLTLPATQIDYVVGLDEMGFGEAMEMSVII